MGDPAFPVRRLYHGGIAALVAGVTLGACTPGPVGGEDGGADRTQADGGGGGETLNPRPTLTALSPATALAGGAAFTLTAEGADFIAGSAVLWSGVALATTFVDATHLSAEIAAAAIATTGRFDIEVQTPGPGGGTSQILAFAVTGTNPEPFVTALSPSHAFAGTPAFTFTVRGTNFASGAAALWNGAERPTARTSSAELVVTPTAADLSAAGAAQVTVRNPAPGGGTSEPLAFTVETPPSVLERISVAADGAQANGASEEAAISGDGRFVAFSSQASNIVPPDANYRTDIFLRDTCHGAPEGCTPTTALVSVTTTGGVGSGSSVAPAISRDGRYVAFASEVSTLVAGDTNGYWDVFVRDTCFGTTAPGCNPSTARVSLTASGAEAALGSADYRAPALSAYGRFVAFVSDSSDIVAGDNTATNILDAFVRDTCAGATACTPTTVRATSSATGGDPNHYSQDLALGEGGRYVAFSSFASNLVAADTNADWNIFVRDTCLGAPEGCAPYSAFVDASEAGAQGNKAAYRASPSASFRYVAFTSLAGNLVTGDANPGYDVFVRDTCIGVPTGCTPTTALASRSSSGAQATTASYAPSLSASGRFVAFVSLASNLVTGDGNNQADVFARDTCVGADACTPRTLRLSVNAAGAEGDAESGTGDLYAGGTVALSADGRYLTFRSTATNLVAGDTNAAADIFLAFTGF